MGQTITIQDLTGGLLTETEFNGLMNALQLQKVHYNNSPWKGYADQIDMIARGAAAVGTWHIELLATSDQEGALGYHEDQAYRSTSHSSRGLAAGAQTPLAKIFVQTARENGVAPSEVASHELLEMMVDPWVTEENRVRKYLDVQNGKYYIAEIGDPVQGEGYDAGNGVIVANFAYPGWWNQPQGQVTIYDYRGTRKAPFELAPGGYISVQAGPGAPWEQIFGEGTTVVEPTEEATPEEPTTPPVKEEPEVTPTCEEEVVKLEARIAELEASPGATTKPTRGEAGGKWEENRNAKDHKAA